MRNETLTEITSTDLQGLLDSAPPALRRAVLRGRQAGSGDDVGSFQSFVDPVH